MTRLLMRLPPVLSLHSFSWLGALDYVSRIEGQELPDYIVGALVRSCWTTCRSIVFPPIRRTLWGMSHSARICLFG